MKAAQLDLDPTALSQDERDELNCLARILASGEASLVGPHGERRPIPAVIHRLLSAVLDGINEKQAMVLMPKTQELSTQEASRILGVSRQFFVDLLKRGELTYHVTGTHRRVYLDDVLRYRALRDAKRRDALNSMVQAGLEAGIYDTLVMPENQDG